MADLAVQKSLVDAFLGGLGKAEVFQRSSYFPVGRFKVQLLEVLLYNSTVKAEAYFIIRTKVIESNTNEITPGMEASQLIKITGNMSAMGNIKAFLAAAMNMDASDKEAMATIDAKMMKDVLESDALPGLVLALETVQKATRSGGTFTAHNWSHVVGKV